MTSDIDIPPPRDTYDLLGHSKAEREFLDAWNAGCVPHAWLIAGPKGIGKATLAYRIARFVLAGGGGGGLFGGPADLGVPADHPAARRIASGGHADFKIVERGWTDEGKTKRRSEIAVEEVRGVGAFLALTPAEGGWRVVIVDAADDMNRSSANAILKVLEEPPRNALMLLVSHTPGRLLPTIRSRCRRLTLRPLADDVVRTLLRRSVPDLSVTEEVVAIGMAEGSIGRALTLCADGGLALYRDMMDLMAGLPRLDVPALHAFGDKVAARETAFRAGADMLIWWMGRAAVEVARAASSSGDPAETLARRLVATVGLDRWIEVWDKIVYSFNRTEAVNLDRKQVMLNAFLLLERACRP